MIYFILQCVYFMLPAYFANMVPVLIKKVKILDKPINTKHLGSHKTWRGLVFGVLAAIIVTYLQFVLQRFDMFSNLSLINYVNWLVIGFLLGFGALMGDIIESFFKRKIGIKPGGRLVPWDQLDYSIGSFALISLVFLPGWKVVITVLLVNFIIHIIANHVAFYLGLSKVKW